MINYCVAYLCVQLHVSEGMGQLLATPSHPEFVFGRISARDKVCTLLLQLVSSSVVLLMVCRDTVANAMLHWLEQQP